MSNENEFNNRSVCKYHIETERKISEHDACIRGIKHKQNGRPDELRRIHERIEQISSEVHTRIDSHIEACDGEFRKMLRGFISRWLFGLSMTVLAMAMVSVFGMQWKILDKVAVSNERVAALSAQMKEHTTTVIEELDEVAEDFDETVSQDDPVTREPAERHAGGAADK